MGLLMAISPINYTLNTINPVEAAQRGFGFGQDMIAQSEQRGFAEEAAQRATDMHPLQLEAAQQGIDIRAAQEGRAAEQFAMDRAAMESQARRKADFDSAMGRLVELGPNATVQDYADLNLRFPELAKGTMEIFDAIDESKQKPLVNAMGQSLAALKAGDVETAITTAERFAEAAENSGDISLAQQAKALADMARANPDVAYAVGSAQLQTIAPDIAKDILGTDVASRIQRTSPIGDGTVLVQTFRDGSTQVVDAVTNEVLSGKDADEAVERALGRKTSQVGAEAGARTRATKEAEAAVAAERSAPEDIAQATESIDLIQSIIDDEALAGVTGMIQGRIPARTQAQQDLLTKIEQVKGKAFLQAFESLKGAGAITEREGEAASRAIARLDRAQSQEAFVEALEDLVAILERPLRSAQDLLAGQDPQRAAISAATAPQPQFQEQRTGDLVSLAKRMEDPSYIPTDEDMMLLQGGQ